MPTIEERALALVNAVQELRGHPPLARFRSDTTMAETLMQSVEAHDATLAEFEAFKREVSDRVEAFNKRWTGAGESHSDFMSLFSRFILAKPDPLVEAVRDCGYATLDAIEPEFVADLRAALAKRGLKLVEVGDAD